MKTLSTILAIVLLATVNYSFAQNSENKDPRAQQNISDYNPERPMTLSTYQPPYFISDKKLATYFQSGSIPTSFPKYNYDLPKKDNVEMVKSWLEITANYNLLTDEGKSKIEEIKNKKNAK